MNFREAKKLFEDKINIDLFVPLISSKHAEISINQAIQEKTKLVLLSGKAGSGKTFILHKAYDNLKEKYNIIFIKNPNLKSNEIINIINKKYKKKLSYNNIKLKKNEHFYIFIDEAQMLDIKQLENIRMLADTNHFTIILSTHEKDMQNIFKLEHFKTRIRTKIFLDNIKEKEIEAFINNKLLKIELLNIGTMFHKKNYKLIYKLTKGNLREINKLMYITFDILDYFYKTKPHKINTHKLQNKFIEMANMDIRGIIA